MQRATVVDTYESEEVALDALAVAEGAKGLDALGGDDDVGKILTVESKPCPLTTSVVTGTEAESVDIGDGVDESVELLDDRVVLVYSQVWNKMWPRKPHLEDGTDGTEEEIEVDLVDVVGVVEVDVVDVVRVVVGGGTEVEVVSDKIAELGVTVPVDDTDSVPVGAAGAAAAKFDGEAEMLEEGMIDWLLEGPADEEPVGFCRGHTLSLDAPRSPPRRIRCGLYDTPAGDSGIQAAQANCARINTAGMRRTGVEDVPRHCDIGKVVKESGPSPSWQSIRNQSLETVGGKLKKAQGPDSES